MKARTLAAVGASSALVLLARAWVRVAPGHAVRWASRASGGGSASPATADALAAAVGAAGGVLRATCLEQGIALCVLLAAARVPARVVLGVARSGDALRAHAWVESDGRIVLGASEASRYSPLPTAAP